MYQRIDCAYEHLVEEFAINLIRSIEEADLIVPRRRQKDFLSSRFRLDNRMRAKICIYHDDILPRLSACQHDKGPVIVLYEYVFDERDRSFIRTFGQTDRIDIFSISHTLRVGWSISEEINTVILNTNAVAQIQVTGETGSIGETGVMGETGPMGEMGLPGQLGPFPIREDISVLGFDDPECPTKSEKEVQRSNRNRFEMIEI